MTRVGWLSEATETALRQALAEAVPDLTAGQLVVAPKAKQQNPDYWSGTATIDGEFVVKFAWAEAPAIRIWREGLLLERLASADALLPVPHVVRVRQRPALVITEVLPGAPMSWEWASQRSSAETRRLGTEIGAFLARLHALPGDRLLADLPQFTPAPQSDTTRLRLRYPPLVDDRRAQLVLRWCDWVDTILGRRVRSDVLVHGDFHGFNQLWDHSSCRLVAVVDFEEAGMAEAEFDFRYLPGNSRTPELTLKAIEGYEDLAGQDLDLQRVLAWNVRTHLGDALWRTEASAALPGGGDATTWVDDLADRLRAFGIDPW